MKVKLAAIALLSVTIVGVVLFQMLPDASNMNLAVAQAAPHEEVIPKIHLEAKSYSLNPASVKQLSLVRDPFETPTDLKKQYNDMQTKYDVEQALKLAQTKVTPITDPSRTPSAGFDGSFIDNGSGTDSNATTKKPSASRDLIDSTLENIAYEYRIDPLYVKAVIFAESNYDQFAVNYNDNGTIDRGLMQINSGTAPGLASALGIRYNKGVEFDLETNLRMGISYLDELRKTNPNMEYVFSAYNLGPQGAKDLYAANKSYKSVYSTKVLKKYDELVNS